MFLYRDVDTSDNLKDVVDRFNAAQKQYSDKTIRVLSTPKVDNTDNKLMRVDAMTEKV